MAELKVEVLPDGTLHYDAGPDGHVVWARNASGHVILPDGSSVNVDPEFVLADSQEHAQAIADAIGRKFAENGHPGHDADQPFVHTPFAVSSTQEFADAVHELAGPEGDSSPQGVLNHLNSKEGV